MFCQRQQLFWFGAIGFISCGFTFGVILPSSMKVAHAEASGNQNISQQIRFTPKTPPPDRGTPQTPYGTGSRGHCPRQTSLPPLRTLVGGTGLDLTVSEHPTFWVYLPYYQADVATGIFSLQEGDEEIYQTHVQIPKTPGIIRIPMSAAIPPLAVEKRYRWYFDVLCPQTDLADTSTPATVTGMVTRVLPDLTLTDELKQAQTPFERIQAYANHHLWYDTLNELGQLRLNDPENSEVAQQWTDLLKTPQVGLKTWADVPLVGDGILSDISE